MRDILDELSENWTPPTAREIENPNLVSVRLAWIGLKKSESEHRKIASEVARDEELSGPLMDNLEATAGYFEALADLCRTARARLVAHGVEAIDGQEATS